MVKPVVAVVGRPNVGKSTFFNKLCGKRISIVKDTPGVTRDRIYADAEWCGYHFTLIDTGGILTKSDDVFANQIRLQAELAADTADVIVFLVDGKDGLLPTDYDIAEFLRGTKKPVVLAVNKLDNYEVEKTYDFYSLGLGEPLAISCEQGKGLGDLLDEVVKHFKHKAESLPTAALKIAVAGKPNVGKSSLVNRILGFERVIVSQTAGTTRDAIDTPFTRGEKEYILIDTAGMRRKRGIESESVESYSVLRALTAIKRADVVLTVFDASEEISEQDIRIAGIAHEEGKPGVIVLNKWDAVQKDTFSSNKFEKVLQADLAFMDYYKSIYVSALSGQRVEKILAVVEDAYANACRRITTGTLNEILMDAVAMNQPPSAQGRRLKIYYATQASVCPPTFVLFVNDESLVHFSYKRYLENCLRRAADFTGTPIRLVFKNRKADNEGFDA
ncbi:MAG: ribosome biogenesis GTPase Der [Firmicutes bacterium]|nr:ribosome biogenesis GTPase Der [Bacillota bacterium]